MKTTRKKLLIAGLRLATGGPQKYQREPAEYRVKHMAANFEEDAFGYPLVAEREDRSQWIVDGGHRVYTKQLLGETHVMCDVFQSEGPQHEAHVFRLINSKRNNTNSLHELFALRAEGDEMATAIFTLVAYHGMTVAHRTGGTYCKPPYIQCARVLTNVYKRMGPSILARTLRLAATIWSEDDMGTSSYVIGGLSQFLLLFGDEVSDSALKKKLRNQSVASLVASAESARHLTPQRHRRFAYVLMCVYNKNKRGNRLTWKD